MMSRHFRLRSELSGAIARRPSHAKNQLSVHGSFFVVYIYTSALRACLRCAAGEHFASAGGSLRSPGVTLVNYKGDTALNMSILLC